MTQQSSKERFRNDPTDVRHGTNNGYSNLGCRCDSCRESKSIANRLYYTPRPTKAVDPALRGKQPGLYDICECGQPKRKISKRCRGCWDARPLSTHCIAGHELTEDNMYNKSGNRSCATCTWINHLKNRYHMTERQFWQMFEAQGRQCAIPGCGKTSPGKRRWCVDHDHACCPGPRSCGKCIRGLLCVGCNTALGHVGDNVQLIAGMMTYLHESPRPLPVEKA